ncbi:MAG: DUF4251 domain-containing protein [Prevotella sp.]|nr:DUF4251 domain-containing protein [Prevotella sp.]
MKKTVFFMMAACILWGCATMSNESGLSKSEKRTLVEKKVNEMLDNRHFKIEVDMMHPLNYPSKSLSTYFSMEIRNDSILSYLPYLGRAYQVPYGGGKALNFEAPIRQYQESFPKKHMRRIELSTDNGEDILFYSIEVFANGNSTIHVQSRNRQSISFDGEMKIDE